MFTFIAIGLILIVGGAVVAGIITFLPTGALIKMEKSTRKDPAQSPSTDEKD